MGAEMADEPVQPAIVVPVGVAQDQSAQLSRVDIQQVEVAVQDFRRVAEIQQVLRRRAVRL